MRHSQQSPWEANTSSQRRNWSNQARDFAEKWQCMSTSATENLNRCSTKVSCSAPHVPLLFCCHSESIHSISAYITSPHTHDGVCVCVCLEDQFCLYFAFCPLSYICLLPWMKVKQTRFFPCKQPLTYNSACRHTYSSSPQASSHIWQPDNAAKYA